MRSTSSLRRKKNMDDIIIRREFEQNHIEPIEEEPMRPVKPWDLLNKDNWTMEEVRAKRLEICDQCPELIHMTKQCKKCGCFVQLKTKLESAFCPLRKW